MQIPLQNSKGEYVFIKAFPMKKIITICMSFVIFSCGNRREEIEELNQRLSRLEKIVASIVNASTVDPDTMKKTNNTRTGPYRSAISNSRCQAITKKGSQCKRKAKNNGYCWQHGG